MPIPGPIGNSPNSLGILQAMQGIIVNECLVGGASPFAALSAADAATYGVGVAVFVGRPKDWKDAYLPQCNLYVPPGDPSNQQVERVGYAGRVFDTLEVHVQAFADLRASSWAGEQQILAIRDALWPAVLRHLQLGGAVATVAEADAAEGRGLCYEEIAGTDYRCYELIWRVRQQYTVAGGKQL